MGIGLRSNQSGRAPRRKLADTSLVAILTLVINLGAWWFPRTPAADNHAAPAPTSPPVTTGQPAPPGPTSSAGRPTGGGNREQIDTGGGVQPAPTTNRTTTAAPRPPVTPPPAPGEAAPSRFESYDWTENYALDLNSDAPDWGAKQGDWSDNGQLVRDIAWAYQGDIGVDGGKAGTVRWSSPITRSSCDEAWTNQAKYVPTMQPQLKFCAFISGAVAMIAVHDVTKGDGPAVASVEIAVWK